MRRALLGLSTCGKGCGRVQPAHLNGVALDDAGRHLEGQRQLHGAAAAQAVANAALVNGAALGDEGEARAAGNVSQSCGPRLHPLFQQARQIPLGRVSTMSLPSPSCAQNYSAERRPPPGSTRHWRPAAWRSRRP